MISVFGHHISLRAAIFAAFELLAFIAIFNVSQAFVLHYALPEQSAEAYRHAYLLPLCCIITFATASACGLYNKEVSTDPHRVVVRLLAVSVLMYVFMALLVSLASLALESPRNLRLYYFVTLVSAAGYFVAALLFRHKVFTLDFNRSILERRVLVVGVDDCAAKVEYLSNASRSPYTVVGFVPVPGCERSKRLSLYKILPDCVLDQATGLYEQARVLRADEIVVASRERRGLPLKALMECKLAGLTVTEFSSFWERQTGQIDLEELTPGWLIFSGGFRSNLLSRAIKRLFDVVVASVVLLLTLPVTLVTALLIKLEGPGPILYRQDRVGRNGAIFAVLKFRSMRTDAEKDGVARWAQNNDTRVTRIGRFIRRTRIDEIPQVINVLKGDMSFVGPRPERPVFVHALAEKIPHYDVRHRIKPGITGWAQINYPYGASDEDAKAKLAYDLYYAKNWGFFLDLVILFQTARVVLWPEGVR